MPRLCTAAVLAVVASSSVYADSITPEEVLDGAKECMDELVSQSEEMQAKQLPGKIIVEAIPLAEIKEARAGDTYSKQSHIQYVPYVETTYLDTSEEGSAWRNCMRQKGLPTP